MGLIKAAAGAFGGTMADQWKEFFYCEAIDNDVLVVKGEKRIGVVPLINGGMIILFPMVPVLQWLTASV